MKRRRFACGCSRDEDDVRTVHKGKSHLLVCPEHGLAGRVIGYQVKCIDCGVMVNVSKHGYRRKRCTPCHHKRYPSLAPFEQRDPAKRFRKGGRQELKMPLPCEEEYIKSHPWLTTAQIAEVLGWKQERAEYWCSVLERDPYEWSHDPAERALDEFVACRIYTAYPWLAAGKPVAGAVAT